MADKEKETLKAFVSYSWTSRAHEDRIIQICHRLMNDGVDIVLDKWDLKEGQDKFEFMERMVTDPHVNKVLIFCDKVYAEKSDSKKGGVGTESQIISKKIYEKVTQQKFIPVIFQVRENGEAYLPVFLQARKYIDFSTAQKMHDGYDQLLRAIFDQPFHKKPKLGSPPSHIFEQATSFTSSRSELEAFKRSLFEDKTNYAPLARVYLTDFLSKFENFRLPKDRSPNMADTLKSNINDMLQSRDELLEFFQLAFSYKDDMQLCEVVIEYLEGALKYNYATHDMSSWQEWQFENYRFFNHECFVYLIAILLCYSRYSLADKLMSHGYYLGSNVVGRDRSLLSYDAFYNYSNILDQENRKRNPAKINPTADLLEQRANNETINFRKFIEADFVLFLRSALEGKGKWYPSSLVYAEHGPFEIFLRGETADGFDVLKILLNVSNRDDLKSKYENVAENIGRSFSNVTYHAGISFEEIINLERLFKDAGNT